VDVDVGTHGRASLREKILAKTGAKRAFFNQNSGYINSYKKTATRRLPNGCFFAESWQQAPTEPFLLGERTGTGFGHIGVNRENSNSPRIPP